MNAFLTAVAGAITAAGVGAVTVARLWPTPPGRHRGPRVRAVVSDSSLRELLGDWPEPTHGTPVVWAFRECPNTRLDQPHALHDDGSATCSCCFQTTGGGR